MNNFLDQPSQEASTLNGSINTSIRQNHNTSNEVQQAAPQSYLVPPADILTGPKSYYSSINNILPCVDPEHSATRSIENSMEKPSIKNNTKTTTSSTSKPDQVAKGLTALHSKVDELLKRMPIARESGEKSHRGAASPARNTNNVPNPAQVFTLNAIQSESLESAAKTSVVLENPSFKLISQPHLNSLTTYESQGVFESRVLHTPSSPVRDNLSKRDTAQNTARSSPQNENKTSRPLEFHVEVARDYSDSRYSYKQDPQSPIRTYQQSPTGFQLSPARAYESPPRTYECPLRSPQRSTTEPNETRPEESKPKYDEKKLEAILARIRSKNSVSPAPRQRSSVTPGDTYTPVRAGPVAKTSWSANKNVDIFNDRNGIKTEPNYQLTTNMSHEESSIVDIPNEKDPNVTGHTTIRNLLDKTPKNSKFRDDQPEEEYGERTPPRSNKMVPGERKMRIFTADTNSGTKNANGVPTATIYLPDIIKNIQEDKTLKITDILKDKSASEKKVTERQNFELKEKTLNEKNPFIGQKEDEGIKTRGRELFNQSPEVKKSSKYFTEEEEDAPDQVLKQALYDAGFSATAKTRQKSVDAYKARVNNHFQIRLEEARPTYKPSTESVRILSTERKPQDSYKVNLQALKVPGKEEDSLLPDDSVFSMREGGPMAQKQINTTGPHGGSVPKENMAFKNELDTTVVRNRFLQDDMDISDFDFERNRLDTQEFYTKEGSDIAQRLEDNYHLGVKRQKLSEDKTPSFGLNEKVVPKTEIPPKNGVLGRAI